MDFQSFSTIMDANITTLLVALILYAIGTGPIKGFAVTLSIGIVTSIFPLFWLLDLWLILFTVIEE